MHIYQSNHYTTTIEQILDDCLISAKENPFDIHYLIVDDEKYFEEILLKKVPYLFNIEIISLSNFLKKLLDLHHQTFHKKSTYQNIMEIVRLNKNNKDSLFHQTMNPFQTAKNILNVFEQFYLYEITETDIDLSTLSKKKINTLFSLYQQFDKTSFYEYDLIYSLIDETDHQYYYFLISALDNKKIKKIMHRLDQFGHVYVYQKNKSCIETDYSSYLVNHLFDSYQTKKDIGNPYEILETATIQEEIKQIVFDLYLSLKNRHYYDFAIYYPNDDYYRLLSHILDQFHISYNKQENTQNHAYFALKALLQYLIDFDEKYLIELISSGFINSFQDVKYVSLLKKQYYSQKMIIDENYQNIKKTIHSLKKYASIHDISTAIIEFIDTYFIKDENTFQLTSSLKIIDDHDDINYKEYLQLIDIVMQDKTIYQKPKIDSVYLLSHKQPYSELLHVKTIYCLGLNETVIPQEFKNTQLLLNIEAEKLNYPTTYDQLKKHQLQLQNVFSNRHERIILSYALRNIDGSDLIVSSIIKKIENIINVKTFKKHTLLHQAIKEELYLKNGYDQHLTLLNQNIKNYKQTKNQVDQLQIKVNHNPISASKLEVYNQCPYKYYHQYLLNIDETTDDKLQSHEIGTLVHYVLEKNAKYFSNNKVKHFDNLKKDIYQNIDDYLKNNYQPKFDLPQNQFFIKMIKDDLYNTIIILSKQMEKGLFELNACEKKVFEQLDDIELKGFIDRVDQYQDYIKVIDYKSSQKELNLALAKLGFKIQMLLYLEMLSKEKKLNKGAVLYFNTKKRMLKSDISILEKPLAEHYFKLYKMDGYSVDNVYQHIDNEIENESSLIQVKLKKDGSPYSNSKVISAEELDTLIFDITKHIQELYKQMNTGDIRIYPTRSESSSIDSHINPCPFCCYRPLCGYDVFYNEDHIITIGGKNED